MTCSRNTINNYFKCTYSDTTLKVIWRRGKISSMEIEPCILARQCPTYLCPLGLTQGLEIWPVLGFSFIYKISIN